ncbi:MAG: alpha/beta hydrolase [SAR324 cluster bacterium]|nr:alpha/beta hydrolase [SAR324 cluster bacterium]
MPLPRKSTAKRPRKGQSGNPRPEPSSGEVFLVLPGLNLAPDKLQPLTGFLTGRGHAVAWPRLHGYGPGEEDAWEGVTAQRWLSDMDRAWAEVSSQLPGAAPCLLGYSMGALLGLTWSLSRGIPLQRAIVLSPALRLRWYLLPALRIMAATLPRRLRLPSKGPSSYLAHQGTSLAAYLALADLMREFRLRLSKLCPQPGLPSQFLAYSPHDELLSTRYLARYQILAAGRVTQHRLEHVPRPGCPYHLGIDAHTLGDSEWAALLAALERWLSK